MGTSESSVGDKTREGELRSLPTSYASSERGIRAVSSSSRRTVSTSSAARRIRASGSVRAASEVTRALLWLARGERCGAESLPVLRSADPLFVG